MPLALSLLLALKRTDDDGSQRSSTSGSSISSSLVAHDGETVEWNEPSFDDVDPSTSPLGMTSPSEEARTRATRKKDKEKMDVPGKDMTSSISLPLRHHHHVGEVIPFSTTICLIVGSNHFR